MCIRDSFIAVTRQPPCRLPTCIPDANGTHFGQSIRGQRRAWITRTSPGMERDLTSRGRLLEWFTCIGEKTLIAVMKNRRNFLWFHCRQPMNVQYLPVT